MKIYYIGKPFFLDNTFHVICVGLKMWIFARWYCEDINGKVLMNGFRILGINFEIE